MSRWIDYDAIDYRNDKLHDKSSEFLDGVIYMAERIENAPSIKLVRCRDCRYCTTDIIVMQTNNGYERVINLCQCPRHKEEWSVDKDWYCADGERKESE